MVFFVERNNLFVKLYKKITVKQLAIQIMGYGGNSPGPRQDLPFSDRGKTDPAAPTVFHGIYSIEEWMTIGVVV